MSFTLVGNRDFVDNGGSAGLSFLSQEVAVGDLIIISVRYEGGGSSDTSTVSVADTAGNTYNVIASQTAGEGQRIHLLYAISQSVEAFNAVTVTFSSSRSWRRANYTVFSSTSTPSLVSSVQDFSAGNTLTWDAGTLTGVKTDDMVIGWFGYYNTSGAGSEAVGFTEIDNHTLGVLEYKIATSDGSQDVTAIPNQADSFAGIGVLFTSGSSVDTLSPETIISSEDFGAPLLTTGQVLVNPEAISSSEFIGTHLVQQGATFIVPIPVSTAEVFGNPIVTPLGVTVQPAVISTEGQVGEPVLVAGVILIAPTDIGTNASVNQPIIDLMLKQIFPDTVPPTLQVTSPSVFGGDSIAIPVTDRVTWNAIAKYLRTLSFKGQDNDVIQAWLRSEGFESTYNDNWYEYLVAEGFEEGTHNDKYALWRRGG